MITSQHFELNGAIKSAAATRCSIQNNKLMGSNPISQTSLKEWS